MHHRQEYFEKFGYVSYMPLLALLSTGIFQTVNKLIS